jgi:diguanylate cyclase (GGDEF)-like protein
MLPVLISNLLLFCVLALGTWLVRHRLEDAAVTAFVALFAGGALAMLAQLAQTGSEAAALEVLNHAACLGVFFCFAAAVGRDEEPEWRHALVGSAWLAIVFLVLAALLATFAPDGRRSLVAVTSAMTLPLCGVLAGLLLRPRNAGVLRLAGALLGVVGLFQGFRLWCVAADLGLAAEFMVLGATVQPPLVACAGALVLVGRITGAWERARRDAERDALTGLPNRRAFERAAGAALEGCRRHGQGLALIVADLDGLKPLNDRFGHLAGDEALASFGRSLRDLVRLHDLVARVGGDEFVVLAPSISPIGAAQLLERLERSARARSDGRTLTASFGMALCGRDGDSLQALFAAADRNLLAVKRLRAAALPHATADLAI